MGRWIQQVRIAWRLSKCQGIEALLALEPGDEVKLIVSEKDTITRQVTFKRQELVS